jgi:uncharacterized protein (DUF2236 family)
MTFIRDAASASIRGVFRAPDDARPVQNGDTDAGLFGPDSVTWRVHGHLSVLVGGVRALLVQTLHPLAMAGVAQHSQYRSDPLGRLGRTAAFVGTTTYGTTSEADAAIATVRRVHERVRGFAPDGREYAANDPELLAWVHYVEVQSFLLAYQRIGPGCSPAEADRYVAEMARFGARMGVRESLNTAAALHEWVDAHPEQRVTGDARAAVRFLMWPALPVTVRGPYTVLLAAAISLIPFRQRLALGLVIPGPVAGRVVCEPAARALVGALGWTLGPSPALRAAHARVDPEAAVRLGV